MTLAPTSRVALLSISVDRAPLFWIPKHRPPSRLVPREYMCVCVCACARPLEAMDMDPRRLGMGIRGRRTGQNKEKERREVPTAQTPGWSLGGEL